MDEKELLNHYKQTGSLVALGELYSPYMSLLYGVSLKYLGDPDKSQDAVMQIFEELIVKLRTHQITNFKSWLYVYARNYCLMQIRKDKKIRFVDIDLNIPESEQWLDDSVETETWQEKDFDRLEKCLLSLATEQERCLRLFYFEKRCYKDIATATGYELSKIKSYIQNGKRNLKICMNRDGQ